MNLFPDALISALLGYGVVFFGLALLLAVVVIMGKVMSRKAAPAPAASKAPEKAPEKAAAPAPAPTAPTAPGSAGQVKLYDVPDKDAALLMAIVANKLGKPLNELRFKSIKEVK